MAELTIRCLPAALALWRDKCESGPFCDILQKVIRTWKQAIRWKSFWRIFPPSVGSWRFKFSKTPRWPSCSMRILLDESVPGRLGSLLTGLFVVAVQRRGYGGTSEVKSNSSQARFALEVSDA